MKTWILTEANGFLVLVEKEIGTTKLFTSCAELWRFLSQYDITTVQMSCHIALLLANRSV